jgi:hypothetical protein
MQNLQLKSPYKFKKSYGGTQEPQTPQDATWLRGPSLKKKYKHKIKILLVGNTIVNRISAAWA